VDTVTQGMNVKSLLISITINGAEVEAVEGMKDNLARCRHIRLSIAGWYKRGNQRICKIILPMLKESGLSVFIGRKGGVIAWK